MMLSLNFLWEKKIFLSLKCFGPSESEKQFNLECKKSNLLCSTQAEDIHLNAHFFSIYTSKNPTKEMWADMRYNLPSKILEYKARFSGFSGCLAETPCLPCGKDWSIHVSPIFSPAPWIYSPRHHSYAFQVFAPSYKNETQNTESKISEACQKTGKNSPPQSEDSKNIIMIRLHYSANMSKIEEWCNQYISENPDSPIGMIILYQDCICDIRGQLTLTHCIIQKATSNYLNWSNINKIKLKATALIGEFSSKYVRNILRFENDFIRNLEENYIYRSGQIFYCSPHFYGCQCGNIELPRFELAGVSLYLDFLSADGRLAGPYLNDVDTVLFS